MKRFRGSGATVSLAFLAAIVAGPMAVAQPGEAPLFSVEPVSRWGTGQPIVSRVNEQGSFAGSINTTTGDVTRTDAFFQPRGGERQLLGQLPGGPNRTSVRALNQNNWVVGHTEVAGLSHAIAWNARDGLMDLGLLPGGRSGFAIAVNDNNQVVGYYDTATFRRPFQWEQGVGVRDLGGSPVSASAMDINDRGTVVGFATSAIGAPQHATMWTVDGRFLDLGALPAIREESGAFAVNDSDHVTGTSATGAGNRAFFWSEQTGMTDLGTLPQSRELTAADINNKDWVVGTSFGPGNESSVFLWAPNFGLRDVNDLLAPDSRDWHVWIASTLNDQGQIVATGRRGGDTYTVLLRPVPEPMPALLIAACALGMTLQRRPRRPAGTYLPQHMEPAPGDAGEEGKEGGREDANTSGPHC